MVEILAVLTAGAFIMWAEIIFIILIAILLEYEREGWATTIFSLGAALLLFNFRVDIWEFVQANYLMSIGFVAGYLILGISWSMLKWRMLIKPFYDHFESIKQKCISMNGEDSIKHGSDTWNNWINFLSKNFKMKPGEYKSSFYESDTPSDIIEKIAPQAKNKKSIVTSWIMYWPASLGATFLNDPIRKFFTWIYDMCSGVYDKISGIFVKNAMKGM